MKGQVLIINDDKVEMAALNRAISEDYRCVLAMSVNEGVKFLASNEDGFSAVVIKLDIKPMSGLRFLQIAAQNNKISTMPFIVTVESDDDLELDECFELGVVDYIAKPFITARIKRCVDRNISVFNKFKMIGDSIEVNNASLQEKMDKIARSNDNFKERQNALLEALGTVVEYRNLEDTGHVRRVKRFTEILGKSLMELFPECGLTEKNLKLYAAASVLHDVGKICIPDDIMLKPGKMSDEEYEFMKSHTTKGIEILESIKDNWDDDFAEAVKEICRWHHERYDGRGYPDRLEGDKIPISAQLVSIADTYDALVTDRVYKKAYTKQEAFKMMTSGECGEFSPQIMEAFRQSREQFEAVVDELGNNESLNEE